LGGNFLELADRLCHEAPPPQVVPTGVQEAALAIAEILA
jgi:hypothetical protein